MGFGDDFDSVDFSRDFVLRLHGCAAQLFDNLVLIYLVTVPLSLHDAHHYVFPVCLVGEVHDLFRVARQLDSDGEDLEFVLSLALACAVVRGLDEDLRIVACIRRGQIYAQLLDQFAFGVLPEAEFTVSYLDDAGGEAASLSLYQARVDLTTFCRAFNALLALELGELGLVEGQV